MQDSSSQHKLQQTFLEEQLSHEGIELKKMNKRKDQSLIISEADDISKFNNTSDIFFKVKSDAVLQLQTIQQSQPQHKQQQEEAKIIFLNETISQEIKIKNDSITQDIIQIEQSDLKTDGPPLNNERNKTFQSTFILPQDGRSYLKENLRSNIMTRDKIRFNESRIDGTNDTTIIRKQRKSIQILNNAHQNNSYQNMTLIAKIRKKLNYFYQMFTQQGRLQLLKNTVISGQINDRTAFSINQDVSLFQFAHHLFNVFLEFYENTLLQKIPVIDHYGNTSFCLLMFFSVFNSFFFFFLSLIIVFGGPENYLPSIFFFTAFLWILEMLIKINTRIYKPFKPQYNRKMILISYLRKRSFCDIIPMIILFYSPTQKSESTYLKILLFIKLKNVITDIYDMQKQLCMMFKDYFFIKLVNLIIQLFVIGHIIACVWYLLGLFELYYMNEPTTWFDEGLSSDLVWWKVYLAAVYWSLTLMTTGSNIALTVAQTSFTCFIMLFTTIVFGYLLNVIGIILSELDKQNETKNRDINLVNQYMREKNISRTLKTRVNMGIEYYYENSGSLDYEEDDLSVLKKLPKELNEQLKREYSKQIIQKIEFISQNFSQKVLDNLGMKMQEFQYFPNQTIYSESELDNISLIFILSGEGDATTLKPYKQIKKNQAFGQYSFFTGLSRESTAKATKFTKIIKISREDFLELIDKNSKDYEIFCQLKDNVSLYDNFKDINQTCTNCNGQTHTEINCAALHLTRDYGQFKSSFLQKLTQTRQQTNRRNQFTNTLSKRKEINDQIKIFLQNQDHESVGSQSSNHLQSDDDQEFYEFQDQANDEDIKDKQNQQNQTVSQLTVDIQPSTRKKSQMGGGDSVNLRKPSLSKHRVSQLVQVQFDLQPSTSDYYDNMRSSNIMNRVPTMFEKQANENNTPRQSEFYEKKSSLASVLVQQQESQNPINPWIFDELKDYNTYFQKGNSKQQILKTNRIVKKKLNLIMKRKAKKQKTDKILLV